MLSAKKVGVSAAAFAGAALVLLVAAWAVDSALGGTEVRRNVEVAGQDVGGLDRSGLTAVMERIDAKLAATPVEIQAGARTLRSDLGQLGVSLDREATAEAAFAARSGGFVLLRPMRWLGSFFSSHDAAVQLRLNDLRAAATLAKLQEPIEVVAKEPSLAYRDGALRTVEGRAGSRLDPAGILSQLAELDGEHLNGSTIELKALLQAVAPTMSNESAEALLRTVQDHLDTPLQVTLGEEVHTFDPNRLQPFIRAQLTDDQLVIDLDDEATLRFLGEAFPDVGTPAEEPALSVTDGRVFIDEGTPGTTCCAASAVAALANAIETGATEVELSLAPRLPLHDAAYYRALGVKELVASFTTEHPCCAPRVRNIHRMADIVGPRVLAPGETFSLNDTVGRRTIDNGFVAAPVINGDGNFDQDVGGGVSQFSTTLFNAAFFGGLEIDEYMAHGLYISRYPYGREATLSYPELDLKIRNTTPYGVLIWPTYTDTSITVSLYSTKYLDAAQSGQTESLYGTVCKQVTTLRTRTVVATGVSEIDRFYALYAPGEGVQCDGTTRPKPGETTTTTLPGAPTTSDPVTPPSTAPPGTSPPGTAAGSTPAITTNTGAAATTVAAGAANPPTTTR